MREIWVLCLHVVSRDCQNTGDPGLGSIYQGFGGNASPTRDLVTDNTGLTKQAKKKGAEAPFLKTGVLSSSRAPDAERIGPAKRITFAGLITDVAGVKVTIH